MTSFSWKDRGEFAVSVLVYIGCAYLLLLYMGLGRAIWGDEFLHFAVAAEGSSDQAWALIRRSILSINHNQTGTYMMLDYWLERAAGASSTMLRFPSILCGCFFLASVVGLFRLLGYSTLWTALALIALLGQKTTMYYIGEARPYFPLVAATLGALVYYLSIPDKRRGIVTICGWLAIIIGTLFHPYFSFYWITIVIVTLVRIPLEEKGRLSLGLLLRHADIPLCVTGTLLYFTLGLSTWLGHAPTFSFDPFYYTPRSTFWYIFSNDMHFSFISKYLLYALVVTSFLIVALIALPERQRGSLNKLITPCLLIGAMLALSVFFALVSYLKHYWIIPRQWVASAALMPLAFVWLWAEIARICDRFIPRSSIVIWLLAFAAVFNQARSANSDLFDAVIKYAKQEPIMPSDCEKMRLEVDERGPDGRYTRAVRALADNTDDLWVEMANWNIRCGGPVWPIFKEYYAVYAPAPTNSPK